MVDPVGSLARSIAALKLSLGAAAARPGTSERSQAAGAPTPASRPSGGHVATLASRIEGIRADDPSRRAKLLRLFIEAALLDEFGDALLLDAGLGEMVERIAATLEASPSARDLIVAAVDELSAG